MRVLTPSLARLPYNLMDVSSGLPQCTKVGMWWGLSGVVSHRVSDRSAVLDTPESTLWGSTGCRNIDHTTICNPPVLR